MPSAIFVVAQHTGGHTLIAFDGEAPVGFALAFAAEHDGRRYWHSHMAGVAPEYQNQGVGRMIKLRQREDALGQGINRIEWTFDPLEVRNAWFNLERLGVVVRRYIPNCYGETSSPLHGGVPTDRLVAEWLLDAAPRREPIMNRIAVPLSANIGDLKKRDPAAARDIQTAIRERLVGLFGEGYAITGFVRDSDVCHYLLEPFYNS